MEQCIRRELDAHTSMPAWNEDVVESGAVDSMAWVSVVRCVESATSCMDLNERMMDAPRSAAALLSALESAATSTGERTIVGPTRSERREDRAQLATIAGWASTVGQRRVAIADVEREFGLKAGKLKRGAGIESVARVAEGENEATLGAAACEAAMRVAGVGLGEVNLLIATSETCAGFPQVGAQIHGRLLAGESLGALDVGGGCMGVVNAFIIARAMLESGAANCILVASADVHSSILTPQQLKGEFGGLFGDGASAFVLRRAGAGEAAGRYRLGEWLSGGSGAYARAIQVKLAAEGRLAWLFEGEALARAAVGRLELIISDLELRAGVKRADAAAFATHQPNPRLVELLARQLGVPAEKFPLVSRTYGNLGSSTCGAALALALSASAEAPSEARGPIFLASLAPGLLWSGMVLH